MDKNKRAAYRAFNRSAQARAFETETLRVKVYAVVGTIVVAVVVVVLLMALSGVQPAPGSEQLGVFTGPASAQ